MGVDVALFIPIVEGHGDKEALPSLLYRIAPSEERSRVRVNPPIRVRANAFLNDLKYFEKYIALAGAKAAQESGVILILLDCEDNCPRHIGPSLLENAQRVRSDVGTLVALAHREYETWFLTAARSLRGICTLAEDLEPPRNPEAIRDAKGWLSARMTEKYDPILHQLELTRTFDLEQAKDNPSFLRLFERVFGLIVGKDM